MYDEYHTPQVPDLSRFTLNAAQEGAFTSSPFDQRMLSSPTLNARASQCRPPFQFHQASVENQPRHYHADVIDDERNKHYRSNLTPEDSLETFPSRPTANNPVYEAPRTKTDPPIVHGINLVPTRVLPDRFRSIYSFPLFNAVQSKSFESIYKTNDNFVLSAPTGSGKTAVMELAICRLVNGFANGSFKIVYQAPTKALCSERYEDWQRKFAPLDLRCAELTGDTEGAQLRNVQSATIIITTPEKWDSVTRKWKDNQKLMHMVKLFLIDEVHILKEERGATLEAVVSRMKSIGSDVRFVALSATVPNSVDIATWLGKDPMNDHLPATREKFGEEFRPVRLQKHVCGYQTSSNDFAFDKTLNSKLPEVISKWSQRKPIMVFCITRSACVDTAKLLTEWWTSKEPRERYWSSPRKRIVVSDKDLQGKSGALLNPRHVRY